MKINDVRRTWLSPYSWQFAVELNEKLCATKNALHRPTSDGFKPTQDLWTNRHAEILTLEEAADLCRTAHRLAPFCFYNGNTFVAIIRDAIACALPHLEPEHAVILRSVIGHYVAGTTGKEETFQVLEAIPAPEGF